MVGHGLRWRGFIGCGLGLWVVLGQMAFNRETRAAEGNGIEASQVIGGIPFEEVDAHWEGALRDSVLTVEGRLPGMEENARYELRMSLNDGVWESEGSFSLPLSRVEDLSSLLESVPGMDGISGSGNVALVATMVGRGKELKWEGRLTVDDLSLEHEGLDLSVDKLSVEVDWAFSDGEVTTGPGQVATIQGIEWEQVRVGAGELVFGLVSENEWRIGPLALDWAGGHLSAEEVVMNPKKPDVSVKLNAEGIRLDDLLAFTPEVRGRGDGIIDGQIGLRIRPGAVGLEPGYLALRAGSPGRLRIPQRPWFTEEMSPEASNYENLRMVERALEDLELTRFSLDFLSEQSPDVPLRLVIEGKPLVEGVPAPSVSLTLQVHGPVRELGTWLLSPAVRIGVK